MTKYTLECCQWESLLVALSLSHYYCQWRSRKYPVRLLRCSLESRIIRAKTSSQVSWTSKLGVWHVRRPKIEFFIVVLWPKSCCNQENSIKKCINMTQGGKLPWWSRHSKRNVFSRLYVFSRNRIGIWNVTWQQASSFSLLNLHFWWFSLLWTE